MFCDLEELPPFAMATAPIPIQTTIIGPSPLSAMMPDSRDLYFGYEILQYDPPQ
jgi:hypothetical protein